MSRYPLDPAGIFSKIIRGEVPVMKVLETDDALAFLDINPVNPGHVLLIPKGAFPTLWDLPDELASATAGLLPRLCRAVRAATGATAINVVVNNGQLAGQTVDHVHWHIIPRFEGDAVHWPWPHTAYDEGEMARMQDRIRESLGTSSAT